MTFTRFNAIRPQQADSCASLSSGFLRLSGLRPTDIEVKSCSSTCMNNSLRAAQMRFRTDVHNSWPCRQVRRRCVRVATDALSVRCMKTSAANMSPSFRAISMTDGGATRRGALALQTPLAHSLTHSVAEETVDPPFRPFVSSLIHRAGTLCVSNSFFFLLPPLPSFLPSFLSSFLLSPQCPFSLLPVASPELQLYHSSSIPCGAFNIVCRRHIAYNGRVVCNNI